MEGQEGEEMPIIPLNNTTASSYGHMMIHHHHHDPPPPPPSSHHMIMNHILIPSSAAASVLGGGGPPAPVPLISSTTIDDDDDDDDDDDGGNGDDHAIVPLKKMAVIRYRECLKNHAAAMGGNANDGCGEFMPSGEDGTLEALTCSACNCHRNFHRKEIHGGADHNLPPPPNSCDRNCYVSTSNKKLFQLGHNHHHHLHHRPVGYAGPEAIGYHHHHHPAALISSSRPVAPHQMIMSYNMAAAAAESDEQDGNGGGGGGAVVRPAAQMQKKRFRTKFTQEQKEKMLSFAEKAGWKIQKQEEGVVQQFCQEIGVKRRVLKVWMHNNKHNLAKKTAATLLSNPHTQSLETQDRNRG